MQVIIKSRLKEILDSQERSTSWLARKIGRKQPQAWRYVSGEIPKYELQLKIAHVLGVEISEIWPAEVTQ